MRISIFFILISITTCSFGQINTVQVLTNKPIITYVDNREGSFNTISFPGDSLTTTEVIDQALLLMVDTSIFQIIQWPIKEEFSGYKYDSTKESYLLESYWKKEFDYMQDTIYGRKLDCETEYFTNDYSKQFLLKHFKQNQDNDDSEYMNSLNNLLYDDTYTIDHQIYLLYTTNSYVTMIGFPVTSEENINDKIEIIKTQIANSVRIYAMEIDPDILEMQIIYNYIKEPYIVNDDYNGIQFTIPFWLNLGYHEKYYFVGAFPDINNISNAIALALVPKSNFTSFQNFVDNSLISDRVEKYSKYEDNDKGLMLYEVESIYNESKFYGQSGFMEIDSYYVFLSYTATEFTYDRNLERFLEFANGIKEIKVDSNTSD